MAWLCFLAGGDDLGNRVAQGLRRIPVPGEQPAELLRVAELRQKRGQTTFFD